MPDDVRCTAAHTNGWECELPANHGGLHQGGDYTWRGNCRRKQVENRVLCAVLNLGPLTVSEIVEDTKLTAATVEKHLRALESQELAFRDGDAWTG